MRWNAGADRDRAGLFEVDMVASSGRLPPDSMGRRRDSSMGRRSASDKVRTSLNGINGPLRRAVCLSSLMDARHVAVVVKAVACKEQTSGFTNSCRIAKDRDHAIE
jgi:hypothetical protein